MALDVIGDCIGLDLVALCGLYDLPGLGKTNPVHNFCVFEVWRDGVRWEFLFFIMAADCS